MQHRYLNSKTIFLLILFVGLIVRLLGIASRPIWYDEAFSILFAEKGLSAMLYGTLAPTGAGTADIHPLGYYTLLWLWMGVFGESLVAARLPSIFAGLVSICLIYLIAQEALSDSETARLSMLFAALAPFQIHYSQEIRMYSFLAMWLLLATYAYQRASETKNWKLWLLFSIVAAFAQYTHNLAAFYLVTLALLPLFQRDWKNFQAITCAGLGAIILYFPWMIQLPAQFAKVQQGYWVEQPDISRLLTLLIVYLTNTPLPNTWIIFALFIALITVTIGVLQTARFTRQTKLTGGIWAFYLAFAPPLLLFLFSQWKPVYIERALLPSGAIFCIWLAWVLTSTNLSKWVITFLIGLLVTASGMGIYQHVAYRDFPYGPFKELDAALRQRIDPQDAIVHSNKMTFIPAMLYDPDLPQNFISDEAGSTSDTLARATQEVLGIQADTDIQSAVGNSKRVWYIMPKLSVEELQANRTTTDPQLDYLNAIYTLESQETWGPLQVYLFVRDQ
ncbi:MAG: glycosyltransferase family 39 protein [Anaerolineales bacterium]